MFFNIFGGKPVLPQTDFIEHALNRAELQDPTNTTSFCVDGLNYINSIIFDYKNVTSTKKDGKIVLPEVSQRFYPIVYKNIEGRVIFDSNCVFINDFYPDDDHIFSTREYCEYTAVGFFSEVMEKLFTVLKEKSPKSDMIVVFKQIDRSDFSGQKIKYIITELHEDEKKDESDDMTCIILNYIGITDYVMSQDLFSKLFTKRPKNKFKWKLYNFTEEEKEKIMSALRAKKIKFAEEKGKIIIDMPQSLFAELTAFLEGIRHEKIININPELNMDKLGESIVRPRAEYFINPVFVSFNPSHHQNKNYEYYYSQRFVFYTLNKFAQLYKLNKELTFEEFLQRMSGKNKQGQIAGLLLLKYRDKMRELEEKVKYI